MIFRIDDGGFDRAVVVHAIGRPSAAPRGHVIEIASVGVDVAGRLRGLVRRQAERDERRARRRSVRLRLGSSDSPPSRSRRSTTTLRDHLADARYDREGVGVGRSRRVRAHRRRALTGQTDLRAHAGHAREQIEELTFVGRGESVQGHRVVADHHAGVHARGLPNGGAGSRPRSAGNVVADAADREHHARGSLVGRPRLRGTRSSGASSAHGRLQPGPHQMRQRDRGGVHGIGSVGRSRAMRCGSSAWRT